MNRTAIDPERCSVDVCHGGWWSQCGRKHSVSEGGKPYCKQHTPSRLKAAADKRRADWEVKFKRQCDEAAATSILARKKTDALELVQELAETNDSAVPMYIKAKIARVLREE